MKIKPAIGCALMFLFAGCKREAPPVPTQPPPATNSAPAAANPAPAVTKATATPPSIPAPPHGTEWDKVVLGSEGEIMVNKKRMTLKEFDAECQRLKKVGGAVLLYVKTPNQTGGTTQADALRKIVEAGVPMKAAKKESELN